MELLCQIFVACGAQGPPPLIIGVQVWKFSRHPLVTSGNFTPADTVLASLRIAAGMLSVDDEYNRE